MQERICFFSFDDLVDQKINALDLLNNPQQLPLFLDKFVVDILDNARHFLVSNNPRYEFIKLRPVSVHDRE